MKNGLLHIIIMAVIFPASLLSQDYKTLAPVLNHPGYLATLEKFWPRAQNGDLQKNRSVSKALVMSAVVPGLGQAYNRSYIKAGLFAVLEGVAWYITIDRHNKGNRLEDEFEAFADSHWDEYKYWDALWKMLPQNLTMDQPFDMSQMQMELLRAWERENFSHHLPEEKNQTYYENVGKYNQFSAGWDRSENREDYTFMRKEANDAFELSRTFSTVIVLNHIVSALDAAYTSHRANRALSASLNFKAMQYEREYIPALALRVTW